MHTLIAATRLRRFLNFSLDLVFWQFAATGILILYLSIEITFEIDNQISEDVYFYTCWFISFWLYFFGCEVLFQRTVGELITRTKVVSDNGKKPSEKSIFIRTLIKSIPVEYLSFLHARIGHHDIISQTMVVRNLVANSQETPSSFNT